MKNRIQPNRSFGIFLQKNRFSKAFISMKLLMIKWLFVSLLFSNFLFLFPNSNPVYAQSIVKVTADQPNIWTLEQAHYLLAQMHRRNLDLRAKGLDALDPNEINGVNIDILKSIMEIGATYDDAARFNNNLTKQDKDFNAERRRQLTRDIDELNREKLELTRIIATLKREKETAKNDDEKEKIEAQIIEKTEIKGEVESQLESKRQELSSLSSANGNVSNTASSATFNPQKFPSGFVDEEIKAKIKQALSGFDANPKLNASLQLDKFLQLQYEIVSKQLTLLRDEVGPGERLLFLELPQSINAPYDKSNKMWAQSRWRISGYTGCVLNINELKIPCHKVLYPDGIFTRQNRPPRSTLNIFESVTKSDTIVYDRTKFSILDIKNRAELTKRFVNRNKDFVNAFFNRFYNNSQQTNSVNPTESESAAEKEYKKLLEDYLPAKQKYDEILKACADEAKTNANVCNEDTRKIDKDVAEKKVKDLEQNISTPSPVLLNLILNIINKAIEDSNQLNKIPELKLDNQTRRTIMLSRIEAVTPDTKKLFNRLWIEDLFLDELYRLQESDFEEKFFDLTTAKSVGTLGNVDNRVVRTVEIIPRQSSLNVNDVKVRNKSSALNFVISTLFGLGGNFNYQQQREKYSQFVQQELYSSGFGKGAREFGWTFTSMPGTDRLLSGTRNTYAVVMVPQEATSVVIESIGCSFRRAKEQPEDFKEALKIKETKNYCSESKSFVIPIPGGGNDSPNDFYVNGITYEPVERGRKIVVSVYGDNFSHQIGVMIDGVPLLESIGLAQNFIRDDSLVAKEVLKDFKLEKVKGSFERVGSKQIIISFEIADGRDGTPLITLVSPGKALDLNPLPLYINGRYNKSLKDEDDQEVKWMFGKKLTTNFKVDDTQVFVSGVNLKGEVTELTALITGSYLESLTNVFVNGEIKMGCLGCGYFSPGNVHKIVFPPPNDERIQIVLVSGNNILKLNPIANPAKKEKPKELPSLNSNVLNFTVKQIIPNYSDKEKTKIAQLLVEIEGKGFSPALEISSGQLDVVSETKAFITITDPKPAQTIRLTDNKKNVYAIGVVEISEILKPTPQKTPTPSPTPSPSPSQ